MAGERAVPLLPCRDSCRDIDEIADFYLVLGFEITYRQQRPSPYLALRREDLDLRFFGMPEFNPEDSHGTCLVIVADTQQLFDAFAAGLGQKYGKLPVSGLPRITRPRRRKNAGYATAFSLIDPGGNWIRITRAAADAEPVAAETQLGPRIHSVSPASERGQLGVVVDNAVVLADSHGDERQALKILAGGLRRLLDSADRQELAEALRLPLSCASAPETPSRRPQSPSGSSAWNWTLSQF